MLSTQSYKGSRDFYPDDKRIQDWMLGHLRSVVHRYGYEEYDAPFLEPIELYQAKTGDEIVNQQLYSLVDRGERKLAIRPEMTPSMARMVAGKFQELPKPVRWFSIPNVWRYERPQRGRLREHYQLNVDVLGGDSLLADCEILMLAIDIFVAFGLEEKIQLRVNNRKLVDHVFGTVLGLSTELAHRAVKLIDAKDKMGPEKYMAALAELGLSEGQIQGLNSFLSDSFEKSAKTFASAEGIQDLSRLFELMDFEYAPGKKYSERVTFDPAIMRGLEYYTGTVFEAYDISPENNRALFGGGRYDDLLGLFGKNKLSGMGFGLGDVGLRNFLETHAKENVLNVAKAVVDVCVCVPRAELFALTNTLAQSLRKSGLRVITPLSADGFGNHLKLADKHGAKFAVLLGDTELAEGKVVVKNLKTGENTAVAQDALVTFIRG
jgi:histidyl-tRNA synthetase